MLLNRIGPSRRIRALACPAIAIFLGSCISLQGDRPSGAYSFDVGAQAASFRTSWVLDDLPTEGSIQLAGYITPRTQRGVAAAMAINLGDPRIGLPLARIEFIDPHCEGAYEFAFEHRTGQNQSVVDYFDRKLPWESPLKMQIDWRKDMRFTVSIEGVGRLERVLQSHFDRMSFDVSAGTLHVEKLTYVNLNSK